jgi:phage regulator Rha-like protein
MTNSIINLNQSLVFCSKNGTPLTTTEIIARALNKTHHDILQLVKNHEKTFNSFGKVVYKTSEDNSEFEILNVDSKEKNRSKQGRKTIFAYLTEPQAYFLVTLMRNTAKVVDFKSAIIHAFFAMKEKISNQAKEIEQKRFNRALTEMYDLGKRHGYEERGRSVMSADEFENMCKVFQFLFDERSNSIGFMHDLTDILHKLTAIKEHLNLMGTGYIATHSQIINSLKRIREEKAKK